MEKLCTRLIFCLCVFTGYAQDYLFVFEVNGTVFQKQGNNTQLVKKGDAINSNSSIVLTKQATIIAIDRKGKTYKVSVNGNYNLTSFLKHKVETQKSNITSQYFKYIWNEFTNKNETKTVIGGVFRGERLMLFPKDSAQVLASKITFTWKTDSLQPQYYFFIKNTSTDEILKIATNGSELTLFGDNPIFNDSHAFEWMIATVAFPNLKNAVFNRFLLVDRTSYESKKAEYSLFINDLNAIGLSKEAINKILCETYGLCKF